MSVSANAKNKRMPIGESIQSTTRCRSPRGLRATPARSKKSPSDAIDPLRAALSVGIHEGRRPSGASGGASRLDADWRRPMLPWEPWFWSLSIDETDLRRKSW